MTDLEETICRHQHPFEWAASEPRRSACDDCRALGLAIRKNHADIVHEAAKILRRAATQRFSSYGPEDARGAAIWDAASYIDPVDQNDVLGLAHSGVPDVAQKPA